MYNEGVLKLSVNCAKQAAQQHVKHYVEISSGNMHSSEKVPHKEDGPVEPWTFVSKWKRQVRFIDLVLKIICISNLLDYNFYR